MSDKYATIQVMFCHREQSETLEVEVWLTTPRMKAARFSNFEYTEVFNQHNVYDIAGVVQTLVARTGNNLSPRKPARLF